MYQSPPKGGSEKGGSGKKETFKRLESETKVAFRLQVICWSDPPLWIPLWGSVSEKYRALIVVVLSVTTACFLVGLCALIMCGIFLYVRRFCSEFAQSV